MYQLFDEVTFIVKKPSDYTDGYQQAFVFDSSNKSQKKTAMKWAGRDFEKEVTMKNQGFSIELYNSALNSSQGGKLSFWDCLITLPDESETYLIGINTELLFNLLKEEEWKQGACQEEVFFAKDSGKLGLLTKNMKNYKLALKDMKKRELIKTGKKTNKYEIGKNYLSLNEDFFYIGEVYTFADINKDESIILTDKKKTIRKVINTESFFQFSYGSSNFSDFLNGWKSVLSCMNLEDDKNYWKLREFYYFSWKAFSEDEKLPSRTIGTENIKFSENWKDELYTFELFLRQRIEEVILNTLKNKGNCYLVDFLLEMYFTTSFPDKIPELTIELESALRKVGYKIK